MSIGYPFQGVLFYENSLLKIIGIDPGLQCTGWGIIQVLGNSLAYVAHGTLKTNVADPIAKRLNVLHQGLMSVLQQYNPLESAVEEIFMNQNPASALKLGMARGVVLFTPAAYGLEVFEYSANKVKKSVVGSGHAEKSQVALMVSRLLPTMPKGVINDAADALAVAICHAHHRNLNQRLKISV